MVAGFRPLFVKGASVGYDVVAERVADEDDVLCNTIGNTKPLEARRTDRLVLSVLVPAEDPIHTDVTQLTYPSVTSVSKHGSNTSLYTLVSSAEMKTHEEAAKLSPTNAPIMKRCNSLKTLSLAKSV